MSLSKTERISSIASKTVFMRAKIAPFEVVVHNKPDDCWVSFLGKVYNITPLIEEFRDQKCVLPLLAYAGKDITNWFDEETQDIQYYVHPVTGARVPYCPHGRIPHVPEQVPTVEWKPLKGLPWWKDDNKYLVGYLTKRVRPIRIIDNLFLSEIYMNVCCEDTIYRIAQRYSIYNSDMDSYTWKYNDEILDFTKTLEENGIIDQRDRFTELMLPQNLYVPGIFLYYNDNMKYDRVPLELTEIDCGYKISSAYDNDFVSDNKDDDND